MLYDLATASPEPGSLLESVFLIISKRRQEQEFLRTRTLVSATLAPHVENNKLSEVFEDYFNAMFPWLKKEREDKEQLAKEALKHWAGKKAFAVRPLWTAKQAGRGIKSRLRKGAEKVRKIEEERRKGRLRRLQ